MSFGKYLTETIESDTKIVNEYLSNIIKDNDKLLHTLHSSMNYSLLAGGKRVRPFLVIETFRLFTDNQKSLDKIMPLCAAVEMIHTYSLIHDDLPCMDNDDLRRGLPTNHKIFGDACAVLAGDALLTYAFEVAAKAELPADLVLKCISLIASAAGACGMVGGQIIDLESENRKISVDTLIRMHELKTSAMIKLSVLLGYFAAGMTENDAAYDAVSRYGECIGLVFQIVDDVLDVTSNQNTLGKNTGGDAENGKTTFLTFYSVEEAMRKAKELTELAVSDIGKFETRENKILSQFAEYLYERKN